jgi:hypothetical protein
VVRAVGNLSPNCFKAFVFKGLFAPRKEKFSRRDAEGAEKTETAASFDEPLLALALIA